MFGCFSFADASRVRLNVGFASGWSDSSCLGCSRGHYSHRILFLGIYDCFGFTPASGLEVKLRYAHRVDDPIGELSPPTGFAVCFDRFFRFLFDVALGDVVVFRGFNFDIFEIGCCIAIGNGG